MLGSGQVLPVVIEVSIPADDLPQIFVPYFTSKQSGTGLGLAIVHKIMEAHGGEIKVESVQGQGTTVTLIIPSGGDET